jgi:hypothetical protein
LSGYSGFLKRYYRSFGWDQLLGINSHGDKYTWINTPMIQNDPIYDRLLELGVFGVSTRSGPVEIFPDASRTAALR